MAKNYIDNKKLLKDIIDWKASGDPSVPECIGEAILKIANHFVWKARYSNYSYRDDLVSESTLVVCKYLKNFDPVKYNNPLAYITQICKQSFLKRILIEEHQSDVKALLLQKAELSGLTQQVSDDDNYTNTSVGYSLEKMEERLKLFEEKELKKKEKKKLNKKKIGLDVFVEEPMESKNE